MKKTTTRLFATLLAALLLCGVLPLAAAAEGTDITDKFTDPAFRAAVQELIGKDVILDTDVAEVKRLDVPGKDINSLAGLEYFTALEGLSFYKNQISVLPDLPAGLLHLTCFTNRLTSLPELPSGLKTIDCGYNQLSALPELPSSLRYLNCRNNQLTSLPALPAGLIQLDCSSNQLSALPALPTSLEILWCGRNQLTSLDVTGLQQLWSFDCSYNNMPNISAVKGFSRKGVSFGFYPQNHHFWATWPLWAQFILGIVLFGWLWMRWL